MNFQGAETMMRESTERVSEAYDKKRKELSSKSDSYLQGYIQAYEDKNKIGRFIENVIFTLNKNNVAYNVACELLETKELMIMDIESLKNIANSKTGLFTSFRKIDRKHKAKKLLEERTLEN